MMENAEEIYHFLEDFSKRKPKDIPQELNDYLCYVARTGDPVYQWPLVKSLFKEKLLNVITDFHETTPGLEIPPCPNVDPFMYDTMKNSLLERLDSFNSAPFTVQRICELLTFPRKQYNRIDKFMRAIEKNILVVSTREPGIQRPAELDNGEAEPMEPLVNGDNDYSVDVDMQMNQWKAAQNHVSDPQPSSSDTHISVDDIEARLQDKEILDSQEKPMEYESVTPPEINVGLEESEMKEVPPPIAADVKPIKEVEPETSEPVTDPLEPDSKVDVEMKAEEEKSEVVKESVVIPEIKVDDVDMTDKRLMEEQAQSDTVTEPVVAREGVDATEKETVAPIPEIPESMEENRPTEPAISDESSSDSNTKEEPTKLPISTPSEVSTSSEESSSSSSDHDHTDGNSNSPKPEEPNDVTEIKQEPIADESKVGIDETIKEDCETEKHGPDSSKDHEVPQTECEKVDEHIDKHVDVAITTDEPEEILTTFESDNYSVADLKSELQQPKSPEIEDKPEETTLETPEVKVGVLVDIDEKEVPEKPLENIGDAETKET